MEERARKPWRNNRNRFQARGRDGRVGKSKSGNLLHVRFRRSIFLSADDKRPGSHPRQIEVNSDNLLPFFLGLRYFAFVIGWEYPVLMPISSEIPYLGDEKEKSFLEWTAYLWLIISYTTILSIFSEESFERVQYAVLINDYAEFLYALRISNLCNPFIIYVIRKSWTFGRVSWQRRIESGTLFNSSTWWTHEKNNLFGPFGQKGF